MAANLFNKLSPHAAFFSTLLANAGFDVADLIAKNDANALKTHLAGLDKGQSKEELTTAIATATSELQEQVAGLEQRLSAAETNGAQLTTLVASLDAAGVKLGAETGAAKVAAAITLHSARIARDMIAKAGHPGLLDDPALDPLKQKPADPAKDKAKTEGLTGRERMAAAFQKEISDNTIARRRN